MNITIEQLKIIMPSSGKRAILYLMYLNDAMKEFEIDTPKRQAAFLATVCVESGQLVYTQEIASGHDYDLRADLGNTRPEAVAIAAAVGHTPGTLYKGHGPIQITGYDNHKKCGEALDLDLVHFPGLLIQPEHGCMSAAWFWSVNHLNKWADAEDWDGVRDVVNRGHKTAKIGDSNGYAEFLHAVARGMVVLS